MRRIKALSAVCSLIVAIWLGAGCSQPSALSEEGTDEIQTPLAETRIVSTNGAISEILAAGGLVDQLVGVDVTSVFPESVAKLPKIGHNRNMEAEGILSLAPTMVLANEGDLKPEVEQQLRQTGIDVHLFPKRSFTLDETRAFITAVSEKMNIPEKGVSIIEQLNTDLEGIQPFEQAPKVLFIYARGAGTLMVAGEQTQMQSIITIAGAENAVGGFESFKPLTAEALVTANPDIVLLFDSGAESLEGVEGIRQIPGMAETNAGKRDAFLTMNGSLLAGFGPRLGLAASQLNAQIHELIKE